MWLESQQCAAPLPIAPRSCAAAATFFFERCACQLIVRHDESVLRRRRDFAPRRARPLWLNDRPYRCLKFFPARDVLRQQCDEQRAIEFLRRLVFLSEARMLLFRPFLSSCPPEQRRPASSNRRSWQRLRRFLLPDLRERSRQALRIFPPRSRWKPCR